MRLRRVAKKLVTFCLSRTTRNFGITIYALLQRVLFVADASAKDTWPRFRRNLCHVRRCRASMPAFRGA